MKEDVIKGVVLDDGRVRWETPNLHGVNHTSADAMLKGIRNMLGGESVVHGHGAGHKHSETHHHHEIKRKV